MKLTKGDAATIAQFREFMQHAGPPDGHARERLIAAGREDLIDWALGGITKQGRLIEEGD